MPFCHPIQPRGRGMLLICEGGIFFVSYLCVGTNVDDLFLYA